MLGRGISDLEKILNGAVSKPYRYARKKQVNLYGRTGLIVSKPYRYARKLVF